MAAERTRSGEPIELGTGAARPGVSGSIALVRDERLEVMRWALPAGRAVPEHLAYGSTTLQCLDGVVVLRLGERSRMLGAGTLVYLAAGERHALQALTDAVLLVTMVLGAQPGAPGGAPVHGERTGPGA